MELFQIIWDKTSSPFVIYIEGKKRQPVLAAGRSKMKNTVKYGRKILALTFAVLMVLSMTVSVFADSVTKDEAINKALKDAGLKKSEVKKLEAELEKGIYEVEFTKKKGNVDFDYDVRKKDGKILEKEVDYNRKKAGAGSKIGKKKARKAAAEHSGVKYSVVKKGSCKYDKGDREYDVKFKSKGNKYSYEIDAVNGKVKEYSIKFKK